MKKVSLIVIGGYGRLGNAILVEALKHTEMILKGAVVKKIDPKKSLSGVKTVTDLSKILGKGDVVIDASVAGEVIEHVDAVEKARGSYILAVTGIDTKIRRRVEEASRKIPVVISPNLSLGVAVLKELTTLASTLLPDFDAEIVESHHKNKKDAPSGTALALAASISEVSHQKIGMHSLRGGDVVGEHRIHFLLDGERIELGHVASHRGIFAKGGIVAAKFIAKVSPGLYTLRDVLFGDRK